MSLRRNRSVEEAHRERRRVVLINCTRRSHGSDAKYMISTAPASQLGLGAAVLQDGHPVTCSSRALTVTMRN